MSESVITVTITRTALSLADLVFSETASVGPYYMPEQDVELGTVTWEKDYARSADLHGAVLVSATKDVVEGCTLDVDVTGADQSARRTNADALIAAFEQTAYTMTVTLDGVSRAWTCGPADSLEGVLAVSNLWGLVIPVRLVFDRSPIRKTPTAPPAPTIGTASRVPGPSISVPWTSNGDGGATLASSTITPYIGATAQTPQVLGATSPQTVTGLAAATVYTFKVKLTNIYGTGADSAASNALAPATTPGAPTVTSVSAGAGSASVTWTPPASDGNSPLTNYSYLCYRASDNVVVASGFVAPPTVTKTVTGLAAGVPVYFLISASNTVGFGPTSALHTPPTVTPT